MNNENLHLFHINENLYLIETTTPKIMQKNGRQYGGWFFKDFYASFKREVPEMQINADEFLKLLEKNNKHVITISGQKENTIISSKEFYDDEIVKNILNKRKLQDPYEDEEDSIDIGTVKVYSKKVNNKKFKQNTGQKSKNNIKAMQKSKNTYEQNRKMILQAFRNASVFPITIFQNMMIKEHGFSFDYKFAAANKIKGSRGKLSTYLDDCDDIIYKFIIKGNLFYFKTKIYGEFLANKRKNYHLKNIDIKTQEGIYHIEILIVNMFPSKVSIDLCELEVIYEKVYGSSLIYTIGYSLMEFLKIAHSPNLILKGDVYNAKVTVIPCFDEEFKVYGNKELFESILKMEYKISDDDADLNETEENDVDMSLNIKIPVRLNEIIKPMNNFLDKYFLLADMNIPRSLQNVENLSDNVKLFEKCSNDSFGLDESFFFIHMNLKLIDNLLDEIYND